MKKYIPPVLIMIALYIIQFIASLCIVCILGICITGKKLIYWFIGDVSYIILVIIYSNNGAYGIGFKGITLDGLQASFSQSAVYLDACVLLVILLVIQLAIIGLLKIIRR